MHPPRILSTFTGLALALAALPALAAWQCSIHPTPGTPDTQLASMAKVSKTRAERIALHHIKGHGRISGAEIEAEQGCLIWSMEVKVRGKSGIEEVNVDAGNGKVLDIHHESAGQEASEG